MACIFYDKPCVFFKVVAAHEFYAYYVYSSCWILGMRAYKFVYVCLFCAGKYCGHEKLV